MNSDTTVNNLHTIIVLLAACATTFGITLPPEQLDAAAKGVVAIIGIVTAVSSWIISHRHHAATASGTSAVQVKPAASVAAATTASILLLGMFCSLLSTGCAEFESAVDPALPGQTNAAPFLAFTNGSAYVLGHAVSSNELYTVTLAATKFGAGLLVKDSPGATNYLADAQLVFQSVANAGAYNPANLATALKAIPVQNEGDQTLIDSIAGEGLSLAGVYVSPLITGNTNSTPWVEAALHAIGDGL